MCGRLLWGGDNVRAPKTQISENARNLFSDFATGRDLPRFFWTIHNLRMAPGLVEW